MTVNEIKTELPRLSSWIEVRHNMEISSVISEGNGRIVFHVQYKDMKYSPTYTVFFPIEDILFDLMILTAVIDKACLKLKEKYPNE